MSKEDRAYFDSIMLMYGQRMTEYRDAIEDLQHQVTLLRRITGYILWHRYNLKPYQLELIEEELREYIVEEKQFYPRNVQCPSCGVDVELLPDWESGVFIAFGGQCPCNREWFIFREGKELYKDTNVKARRKERVRLSRCHCGTPIELKYIGKKGGARYYSNVCENGHMEVLRVGDRVTESEQFDAPKGGFQFIKGSQTNNKWFLFTK